MSRPSWSGTSCSLPNCNRIAHRFRQGYGPICLAHYQRLRKFGDVLAERPIMNRNYGQPYQQKDGYIAIKQPEHPNCTKSGWVLEHIVVMSEMIGRPLHPWESVHHRNGIRNDNRPENLELWATPKHRHGVRVSDKIRWALEILEIYGTDPAEWEK